MWLNIQKERKHYVDTHAAQAPTTSSQPHCCTISSAATRRRPREKLLHWLKERKFCFDQKNIFLRQPSPAPSFAHTTSFPKKIIILCAGRVFEMILDSADRLRRFSRNKHKEHPKKFPSHKRRGAGRRWWRLLSYYSTSEQ